MKANDIKPSENYEGLLIQFNALKRILSSKQAEILVYQQNITKFKVERIIELEAELASEKEMNALLTEELTLIERP